MHYDFQATDRLHQPRALFGWPSYVVQEKRSSRDRTSRGILDTSFLLEKPWHLTEDIMGAIVGPSSYSLVNRNLSTDYFSPFQTQIRRASDTFSTLGSKIHYKVVSVGLIKKKKKKRREKREKERKIADFS